MDIIKHNNQEVVFKSASFVISKLQRIGLFICILSGLISVVSLHNSGINQLSCQRQKVTQVNCQIIRSKFMGLVQETINLDDAIKEAIINSVGKKNKVFLVTHTQQEYFFSKYKIDKRKINKILSNPGQDNLNINYDNRLNHLFNLIFIYPLLFLIGWRLKNWEGNYLTINCQNQQITQLAQNLFGEVIVTLPFTDVKKVEIITKKDMNIHHFYQVNLLLISFNYLGLNKRIWLENFKQKNQAESLVNFLNKFMFKL